MIGAHYTRIILEWLINLKEKPVLDSRIKAESPFTEVQLIKIKEVLGRALPDDFQEFARTYGGAFVAGSVDGDEELPILDFFTADKVLKMLELDSDLKDAGALPVARCELGNLWVIDRKDAVHYINYYGGKTTVRRVADKFSDFISRVVVSDD